MQKKMHNIFLYCGQLIILGNFLLFAGQDQLGEGYLTYSHIWGSTNTLGKNMHYTFMIFRLLQIDHVCEYFHPHGKFPQKSFTQLRNAIACRHSAKIFYVTVGASEFGTYG